MISCKKDVTVFPCESAANQSYIPMTVGSFWVYQWYQVDSSGTELLLDGKIDSIFIEKDTLIGGAIFKKIREANSFLSVPSVIKFRRDSLGYLIDPWHNIYFSTTNFMDTLRIFHTNEMKIIYQMKVATPPIITLAGAFDCLNFHGEITPFLNVDWEKQDVNRYYSRGVGKVQENNFFFSSANLKQYHRRLMEYHIE